VAQLLILSQANLDPIPVSTCISHWWRQKAHPAKIADTAMCQKSNTSQWEERPSLT